MSLWRETPHQALCRKEEQKGGHHAEMQQLSRSSQYSKQQVSRLEGINKEDPTSDKTGRCPSFKRQTGIATSIRPNNGRFPHSNIKKTIFDTKASCTRNTKLPSAGQQYRQEATCTNTCNSSEEATSIGGWEDRYHPENRCGRQTTTCTPTIGCANVSTKEPTEAHSTQNSPSSRPTTIQHVPNQRRKNVNSRHSEDKPAHHGDAATTPSTDVHDSTKPLHTQHNECDITEHERDFSQIRIMHWNAQGLNVHHKQSALIDAILSDNLDIIMIQDSRLKSKDDVLPPIKVPECHTYFKPLSATCHGLLTIVNNRLPSAKHPN